jgi:EmrB/QacA subfamily drug resistance transporter
VRRTEPPAEEGAPRLGLARLIPRQRAVAIIYTATMFISVMDTQIVNVALPTLTRDFRVTTSSVQWVVTTYLMAIAVTVPASGWVGDRFGTKRTFLCAVGLFTTGSLLCALSTNLAELVVMRIIQGFGGGMMTPVGMAMLYRAYPPVRRIHVARVITRVAVIAPATAPLIGGTLVTYASWRWIFTINLPLGALALVFGWIFLVEHREPRQGTFDLIGALCGGGGLGLLLYSVGSGPTAGWSDPTVVATGLAAVTLLGLFVRIELTRRHPVLDLRLLSNRMFNRSCSVLCFNSTAFFGSIVFTGLFLQEGRGLTAIQSGLSTFPEAVAIGLFSQVVTRLYPRVGPRRLMSGGFLVLALACFLLSHAGLTTSLWWIRLYCFGLGIGVAFIGMPNQASSFAQISSASTGHASAIFNTMQRSFSSIGLAALSTIFAAAGGDVLHVRPPLSAFHWVFTANVFLALMGSSMALRIHDEDAANAMGGARRGAAPSGATEPSRPQA